MVIEKIKISNFKRYYGTHTINFNEKYNVIIGNNESGKSTIFTALDLVLSGSRNKIDNIGLESLFNKQIINEFMLGDRKLKDLPEIFVEIYIKYTGIEGLNGKNNSDKIECDGIKLNIIPNPDYLKIINQSLSKENAIFPFEYYKCNFTTFHDDHFTSYNKPLKYTLINESNMSNDYAIKDYIINMYSNVASEELKNKLNNSFRKIKQDFNENDLKTINDELDGFHFGLSTLTKNNLENNLTLYDNNISLFDKGTGMQCLLKILSTLGKKPKELDLILIEEPENHLSDINMKKMINSILNENNNSQLIVTTHNSMICSRLGLKNIIALSGEKVIAKEFDKISSDTVKFFMKNTSNNILNFILSKRVILVEGSAEYILMEKFYQIYNKVKPEDDNVTIISVSGLSFERYLDVAKELKIKVVVITDNDGSYQEKITDKYKDYLTFDNISIYADSSNQNKTFEISVFDINKNWLEENNITKQSDIQKFMLNNKAENAFRILEKLDSKEVKGNFEIPKYIKDAISWIKE